MKVLNQVLPANIYDNNPLHNVVRIDTPDSVSAATDVYVARRQGLFTAAAFQAVTGGYGGPISFIIGVDHNGAILGVRVLAHRETPGLADKIDRDRSDWITAFDGRSLENTGKVQWAVKKDGGTFDQFTGATITPRAMVNGVYEGLKFYDLHRETIQKTAQTDQEE